jgi:hypothetical protein
MGEIISFDLSLGLKLKYSIITSPSFQGLILEYCEKKGLTKSRFLGDELKLFVKSRSGVTPEELFLKSNIKTTEELKNLIKEKCGVENLSKEFCDTVERRIKANE